MSQPVNWEFVSKTVSSTGLVTLPFLAASQVHWDSAGWVVAVGVAFGGYLKGFADGGRLKKDYLAEIDRLKIEHKKEMDRWEVERKKLSDRIDALEKEKAEHDPYNLTLVNNILMERLNETSKDLDRALLEAKELRQENHDFRVQFTLASKQ